MATLGWGVEFTITLLLTIPLGVEAVNLVRRAKWGRRGAALGRRTTIPAILAALKPALVN